MYETLESYAGSAIKFKSRFIIYKSDIKTRKDRWGTARYFNNKCYNSHNLFVYLPLQLNEKIYCISHNCNLKIFYGIEKNIGSPNYLQM